MCCQNYLVTIKLGLGCNSSFNLSSKLCKILNLPMYIQLTYSNISVRLHNYIKINNGSIIIESHKLAKLLDDYCTFHDFIKKHISKSNLINFNKNDKFYKCYNTKKFIY
jgi:hypothetical protein